VLLLAAAHRSATQHNPRIHPQAARAECAELRAQLVARASQALSELRAEAAAEARCIAGLLLGDDVPQAVQAYIKASALARAQSCIGTV
jgi:F0F1-type ATP synthase membrane subunit b/b'